MILSHRSLLVLQIIFIYLYCLSPLEFACGNNSVDYKSNEQCEKGTADYKLHETGTDVSERQQKNQENIKKRKQEQRNTNDEVCDTKTGLNSCVVLDAQQDQQDQQDTCNDNIEGSCGALKEIPSIVSKKSMTEYNILEKNENVSRPSKNVNKIVDMSKPVKVFILLGQSNMLGFGQIRGNREGCLDYAVKEKGRWTHLVDDDGGWTVRENVRNVFVTPGKGNQMAVKKNAWLKVGDGGNFIGPEIQFGSIMGELYNGPVLILKSCIGNRSLGWDLLPPGSKRFEFDGNVYAAYKETPSHWKKDDKNPKPVEWYAGKQYDDDTAHAKAVLDNLQQYVPDATSYEIAGFVFWQGHKDSFNNGHANRYEYNLVNFINSLRKDFDAPHAKFLCATVGHNGLKQKGTFLTIANAQLAMNNHEKYPQFIGNVKTVDIRSSWRDGGGKAGHHYHKHAEVFMEVGDALGWGMVELLTNYPVQNPKIVTI